MGIDGAAPLLDTARAEAFAAKAQKRDAVYPDLLPL